VRRSIVIAVMAAFAAGCTAVLGIEVLPTAEPLFRYASPACATCVGSLCGDDERACGNDALCDEAYGCQAACADDDWACRAACREQRSSDDAAYQAIDGCRRRECVTECFADGAGLSLLGCDCVADACRSTVIDCLATSSCEDIAWCTGAASDLPAALSCFFAAPGGQPEALALFHCGETSACATDCGVGRAFDCAGRYEWPHGGMGAIPYDVVLEDGGAPAAAGFEARACEAPYCGAASTTGCADSTVSEPGVAHLELPNSSGLGFVGCVEIQKMDWAPEIIYFGRPITAFERGFAIQVFDATDFSLLGGTPETGAVLVAAFDCRGVRARGLRFGDLLDATPLYFRNGLPDSNAAETDASGLAVFGGVAPGAHVVQARDAETAAVVASYPIRVRRGSLTQLVLFPNAASR
jgi:hypothetical protein